MKKKIKIILLLAVTLCLVNKSDVRARKLSLDSATIYGESLASDCSWAGIKGSYLSDAKAALDKINKIRYEACKEGVPNPENPSIRLKMSDYVPVKWSQEMEYIARLRAAEASIRFSHTRPNDKDCFSAVSPKGKRSNAETLARGGKGSMCQGIDMWYSEKQSWIKNKEFSSAGHYAIMIYPRMRYVGLSNFVSSPQGYSMSVICGEYSMDSYKQDTSMMKTVKSCVKFFQIKKKYITVTGISNIKTSGLKVGDKLNAYTSAKASGSDFQRTVLLKNNKSWKSSNTKVLTIDKNGRITVKGYGTTKLTVKAFDNKTYSRKLTIKVPKARFTGVKAKGRVLSISWKKGLSNVNGYIICISTDKSFKSGVKTYTVSGKDKTAFKIGNLKSNKKYYVKIRMRAGTGKSLIYGSWSSILSATTK